ncbi:hypothetical protein HanHA300_Chr10g0362011 [Helianthus annuus]|nr:hypothetical protein HanHA300_Chr10g0362011 [Helianthus annuus]KAJ0529905.1 hypothetical protein HanHA89_Chr10g0383501 [Helianthus annuus]KAJ0696777.1 hypothetical protein HanLR1_Chr10g0361211 [Helianthus annuus]
MSKVGQGIQDVKRTRRRGYPWKRCALKVMMWTLRMVIKHAFKNRTPNFEASALNLTLSKLW